MKKYATCFLTFCLLSAAGEAQNILIFEDFETGDFAAKGWYDGFGDQRTDEEFKNGLYSYEGHFAQGATTSGAGRRLFTPTDRVYMSYWVKYSSNYIGSGVGYHPHEWSILTNEDWIYQGPADTYLTTYIEQNAGRPILALQDSKNVDPNCILLNNNSFVGCNGDFNTYPFSEYRSVCSCNGLIGEVDRRDCFSSPGSTHGYYSARAWAADSIYFRNTPGPYYKNDWHFIETYFEMNSIEAGIGVPNGKIRYWYDGQLLITSDSILFRTGIHPDMKFNQLFYGPYIGVGSPVDQTWWVDDLTLADGIPTTHVNEPRLNEISWDIYPTLSDGQFHFRINDALMQNVNWTLSVYDVMGNLISVEALDDPSGEMELHLAPGIYFAALTASHVRTSCKRFMVNRGF